MTRLQVVYLVVLGLLALTAFAYAQDVEARPYVPDAESKFATEGSKDASDCPLCDMSFEDVDTDRDGVLSREEFSNAKKTLHERIKDAIDAWTAFGKSFMMILVTEIGDKTFFIAAVMAMRFSRMAVLGGAISALFIMTVLSTAIGFALPNLLPRVYTHYASLVLFVYFGVKLLKEGYEAQSDGTNEELEEVEAEFGVESDDEERAEIKGTKKGSTDRGWWGVFWQALTVTFLAEWGDRSQIATIALATTYDPLYVTLGGFVGHGLCTSGAVIGGRLLATRISEKTVAYVGGVAFLLFALHGVIVGA